MSNPRNISYVIGFLFARGGTRVALITKAKPDWQKGKLNGVGGKIEAGESAAEAMVREFDEETGNLWTSWRKFCTLYAPGARVVFFASHAEREVDFISEPGEPVNWYNVSDLFRLQPLPNLRWLIPMALDEGAPLAVVHEHDQ